MTDEELLRLWDAGREMAQRLCGRSYARLRAGQGGFYGAEDFEQELFLEFWALAREWEAESLPQEALWEAWRRRLWGNGLRVLRRAPQRLWSGPADRQLPDPLGDASTDGDEPEALEALLLHAEDGETCRAAAERVEALRAALAALRPSQRQVLYLTVVAGLSGEEAARSLDLPDRETVYQRVHAARSALRRRMSASRKAEDLSAG